MTSAAAKMKTIGFCAICERDIAVRKDRLVHHGYQRPGHGYIVGDCLCVDQAPYELSREPLLPYLEMLDAWLLHLAERERGLKDGTIRQLNKKVYRGRRDADFETYTADETDRLRQYTWEQLLEAALREIAHEAKNLTVEIARVEKLYAEWTLKPLRELKKPAPSSAKSYWASGFKLQRIEGDEEFWGIFTRDGDRANEQKFALRKHAAQGARALRHTANRAKGAK